MEENKMKLKPMADNVLLKQYDAPETTASGIILATTNKEKPMIYEIVSVGPGTKEVEMLVKAGDRVVVGKFVGTDVTIDKVAFHLLYFCDDNLSVNIRQHATPAGAEETLKFRNLGECKFVIWVFAVSAKRLLIIDYRLFDYRCR